MANIQFIASRFVDPKFIKQFILEWFVNNQLHQFVMFQDEWKPQIATINL